MPDWADEFIGALARLKAREDLGALAELRRGLVTGCSYFAYRWLPEGLKPWEERAALEVAPLFALHPEPGGKGNLGYSLSRVRDPSESLEKRFVALLDCHREDLSFHLRQAVSLLKSKEIVVNWRQLLRDVESWDCEDKRVQREWARAYWGRSPARPS
jgi:CRISPR system Cascade subunit CasB